MDLITVVGWAIPVCIILTIVLYIVLYIVDLDHLIIIPFLALIVFIIWYSVLYYMQHGETQEVFTRTELVAIRATSDTSGEVSGTPLYVYGTIETNPAYIYYYELEDGGYKATSIPAKDSVIYYIDEETESPHILIYYMEHVDCGKREPSDPIRYEIYIPEGSIIESYEL